MIPLEKQCVSLELAKRLKELGVEQTSYFAWWERRYKTPLLTDKALRETPNYHRIAAFTVAELEEMLPDCITRFTPQGYKLQSLIKY